MIICTILAQYSSNVIALVIFLCACVYIFICAVIEVGIFGNSTVHHVYGFGEGEEIIRGEEIICGEEIIRRDP